MPKIKVHPNDPTMYMFWDVALDRPNAFYVRDQHPSWSWNEDYECPTVSPSIRLIHNGNQVDHLFIRDGKIQYLNDCTHELAGKTVDMVDFPEDW